MTPHEWIKEQRARHGRCRFVPFKWDIHQQTWGIVDLSTREYVVKSGLLLGIARARCNNMNRKLATT